MSSSRRLPKPGYYDVVGKIYPFSTIKVVVNDRLLSFRRDAPP